MNSRIRPADAKTFLLLSILANEPNTHNRESLAEIYGMTPKGVSDVIARARGFGVAIDFNGHPRTGGTYEVSDWGPFNPVWFKENKATLLTQALGE